MMYVLKLCKEIIIAKTIRFPSFVLLLLFLLLLVSIL